MWKESYRIGIERIDNQHRELFRQTEQLVQAVRSGSDREAYAQMIAFLKEYVVYHFADEEAYQASIGYPLLEVHRKTHASFTRTVLGYEKRLVESDFDVNIVRDLAGMLLSWLIYHVANDDLMIATGGIQTVNRDPSCVNVITGSVLETLAQMAGDRGAAIRRSEVVSFPLNGAVCTSISLKGDVNGMVSMEFSRSFALGFISHMTMQEHQEIDQMVCSALAEFTNIALGRATISLSRQQISCDITPPIVTEGPDSNPGSGLLLNTAMGSLKITARLDHN